jgi:nucleobase transporter 1/2
MFHISTFRFINPVVVSPTIAAVGLSFYGYGFPLVGKCIEIGAVQILVVIVFSLVSLFNSDSYFVNAIGYSTVLT